MEQNYAKPLGQSTPEAGPTNQYKDSSPHYERFEATSALIGTLVGQLLQGGAPYSDTLGNFRPIVIGSSGITVNTSPNHVTSFIFHETNSGGPDSLLTLHGGLSPVFAPNGSNAAFAFGVVNDKAVASVTRAIYLITTSSALNPRIQVIDSLGTRNIFHQTHIVRVKAGAPVDGDFDTPTDGMVVVDSTNNRIYARHGGAWHYAALT